MKDRVIAALGISVALLLVCTAPTFADEPLPEDDLALAQRYAPVFYFHPDEVFLPQPVGVMVEQARLRQSRPMWFDVNVLLSLTVPDLLDLESDESHFLDVWYGDGGSSAYSNYSAHQAYYQATLSPRAGGPHLRGADRTGAQLAGRGHRRTARGHRGARPSADRAPSR